MQSNRAVAWRSGTKGAFVLGLCAAALSGAAACSSADHEHLGTSAAAGMTAFANDQTAYDYFRAKGFTNFQAAGIVGNLDQESGIDPTISQQGGGPGRGIAQWSTGGRWDTDPGDNLLAFAAEENQSPDSLGVQLDFIMFELQNFSDYGLAALQATTNVTDATTTFELDFEGCDIADECDGPSRVAYAQSVLDAYGNDPVEVDAGGDDAATSSPDAGGPSDAAAADDSAATAPGSPDAAAPSKSDAAVAAVDASESPGSSGGAATSPAGSEDGGASGAPVAPASSQSSSGCAVARAGTEGEANAGWAVAIGLLIGIARRRRSESGVLHRTRPLPVGLLRRRAPRVPGEPPGLIAKRRPGTLRA